MFKFLKSFFVPTHTFIFHMSSGEKIYARKVLKLEATSDSNGKFIGYSITWLKGCKPVFFPFSTTDIVAITTQ